jgi:signal transduction histidine kinase/sugar lactone lactonase YvrE
MKKVHSRNSECRIGLQRTKNLLFAFIFIFVSNISLVSHLVQALAAGDVTTTSALGIEKSEATLEGLTALSATSERGFEYGTTTSYGESIQDATLETSFATIVHSAAGGDSASRKIAIDSNDDIVAVTSTEIIKYGSSGNKMLEFSGTGSAEGLMQDAQSVDTDSFNNIYIADTGNNRIQKFAPDGSFISTFGIPGTGAGEFSQPQSVYVDGADVLYVADTGNNRIQKFDTNGTFLTQFGTEGTGEGEFIMPVAVTKDLQGNVYTIDGDSNGGSQHPFRVQKFDSSENFILKWGDSDNSASLWRPNIVKTDILNNVYVIDEDGRSIQKYNSSGVYSESLSSGNSPSSGDDVFSQSIQDLDFDTANNMYITDTGNIRVQRSGSSIQASVSSLSCGTNYHFRAYVVREAATYYGQDQLFTTLGCLADTQPQFVTSQLPDLEWDTTNGNGFVPYDAIVEAVSDGEYPTYEVIEGRLPPGLSLDGTSGQIRGYADQSVITPNTPYAFTIAAYNSSGMNVARQFVINVPPSPSIRFPATTLPVVTQQVYYSTYFGLLFQRSSLTTTVVDGELPPGLSLHADDLGQYVNIRGQATNAGVWTFTLQSTDGIETAQHEYTLTVNPYTPPLPINPPTVISITSPTESMQVSGPDVIVQGSAPADSLVEVFADNIHLGGARADTSGHWTYSATGLSQGLHVFKVKYTPEKKVMYIPSTVQNGSQDPIDWQTNLETIDIATGDVKNSFVLPQGLIVSGLTVNADATEVFLSTVNFRDYSGYSASPTQRVYSYNPSTHTVRIVNDSVLPEGAPPSGVVLSPDNTKAYVNNINSVKVIDLQTRQVVQSIEVAPFSQNRYTLVGESVLSPDGKTLRTVYVEIIMSQGGVASVNLKMNIADTQTLTSSQVLLEENFQPQQPFLFPKLVQGNGELFIVYRGDQTSAHVDSIDFSNSSITTVVTGDMLRGLKPDLQLTNGVFDITTDALYLVVLTGDFNASDPFATMSAGYVRINADRSRTEFMSAEGYDASFTSAGIYFDEATRTIHKPFIVRFDDPYSGVKAESFDLETGQFSYSDTDGTSSEQNYFMQGSNSFGGSEPTQYALRTIEVIGSQGPGLIDTGGTGNTDNSVTDGTTVFKPNNGPLKNNSVYGIERILSPNSSFANDPDAQKETFSLKGVEKKTTNIGGGNTETKQPTTMQRLLDRSAQFLGISSVALATAIPWIILILFLLFVVILTTKLVYQLYITAKMRALVEKQKLLNHEKRSLLALSSHYLRTPLTILNAGVDTLPDESRTKAALLAAVSQLGGVVNTIIGKMEADDDLSKTWHPTKQAVQNTRLLQLKIIAPAVVVIGTITAFNIVIATQTNLLVNLSSAVLQLMGAFIISIFLYVVYDSRLQHASVVAYQKELLNYHETLDATRNEFIQDVVKDLVPAVYAVDSAIAQGLPEDAALSIRRGLKRFETTSEDFVMIGQLEMSKIRQKAVDISLQSVVASATNEARHSGHDVRTSGVKKTIVHQPAHLLGRVISTLVNNAVTHGESATAAEIFASTSGNTAELRVVDYGKGIEKEKLSVLFKPLSRVEEAEDFTHEGAGLSLYVNRLIMHYLNGSIVAHSKPGHGTTMTVTVPRYYDKR